MTTDITLTANPDVIRVNDQGVAQFTQQAAKLVTRMLCKEADPMEMAFFASYCKRLNLDPFSGHVHLVKRGSGNDKVARPELSIAGKLLIAERSGKYRGRTDYEWCGEDGAWTDVWLKAEHPVAARVGVYRDGAEHPIRAVALWSSYVGTKYGGDVNAMWTKHGPRMLGKCALSLALSEALPAELGGVYTIEEMAQASNPVEQKHNAAAEVIEEDMLTADQIAILDAITTHAGYSTDHTDKTADDYAVHVNAALQLAVKEAGVEPGTADDVQAAALISDVDAVKDLLASAVAA